ncbi:MAG: hypothetical protein U9R72_00825 [Chloroflexota bacterium]|nr:hypothetical protein [Chloroflexota bacterium]
MNGRSRKLLALFGWVLIAFVFINVLKSTTVATVDYARETGQPCSACHLRPEGGGELNAQGIAYARSGYQWPVPEDVEPYTPSNLARLVKMVVGYLHLTVAVIWFGAIFYIHIVVRPQQLRTGIPRTEGIIGWTSIGIMGVTGTALAVFRYLETGSVFSGTFGTVFIIKLAQVGIMVLLALIATVVLTRRLRRGVGREGAADTESDDITPETLPSLDGRDGGRAVVAVDGKLYDVTDSRLWKDGVHLRQHHAGEDLTEAMKRAPHGAEVLDRVPPIGEILQGGSTTVTVEVATPPVVSPGDANAVELTFRSSLDSSASDRVMVRTAVPAPFAQVYRDGADDAMRLDLIGPDGQSRVKTTPDGYQGQDMAVAETGDGFVYTWYRRRQARVIIDEIQYGLWDKCGDQTRAITNLTDHSDGTLGAYDRVPAVGVAPDGSIGIVWRRTLCSLQTGECNYNIHYAVVDPSGGIVVPPTQLTNSTAWDSG